MKLKFIEVINGNEVTYTTDGGPVHAQVNGEPAQFTGSDFIRARDCVNAYFDRKREQQIAAAWAKH